MPNNFDMSSTGVNLELSCMRDLDLARIWFDDCLKLYKANHNNLMYSYTGAELNPIDPEDVSEYDYTNVSLLELLEALNLDREEFRNYYDCDPEDATTDQLIDYFDTIKQYEEVTEELIEHLDPKFDVLTVRGYCQGDEATIYLPHDYWVNVGAERTPEAVEEMREHLENIVYNQPIYCHLEIDGQDHDLMENISNLYDWEPEKVLENAKKCLTHEKKDYILSWLAANLPEEPKTY